MGNNNMKQKVVEHVLLKCHGDFHVKSEAQMECNNRYCNHGPNGSKIILCPACDTY